ncbi:hypothetical protein [Vibrio marisflavi]|uniref:Lipoprotein n=1 Tax=Vibrio marisflavi CECT 7928 TaxID=634439 RepID=A0ABN8E7H9_9VIBR|nr:hypothetical protein [Vibrio marisflavi]CAH0541712.1 hypothetical protein VMF7928_03776 [Vibrio marisflavi CECT 7928]
MSKLKQLMLAVGALLALSGCQTLNPENIHTSASQSTIHMAQVQLADIPELKVLDNGVIVFKRTLPGGGVRWQSSTVIKISNNVACESLREYVKHGMVVRTEWAGNSGYIRDYDEQYCESIETNHS